MVAAQSEMRRGYVATASSSPLQSLKLGRGPSNTPSTGGARPAAAT